MQFDRPHDLKILAQWQADGVQETTQAARDGFAASDIVSIEVTGVFPTSVEGRLVEGSLVHEKDNVKIEAEMRFSGSCTKAEVSLEAKRVDKTSLGGIIVPLRCNADNFISSYVVPF